MFIFPPFACSPLASLRRFVDSAEDVSFEVSGHAIVDHVSEAIGPPGLKWAFLEEDRPTVALETSLQLLQGNSGTVFRQDMFLQRVLFTC